MWVLGDADHILLVHIEGPLQLVSGGGEAVEDKVLTHAVDPLTPWRESATDEVAPCSLSRGERSHNLTLGKFEHKIFFLSHLYSVHPPQCL